MALVGYQAEPEGAAALGCATDIGGTGALLSLLHGGCTVECMESRWALALPAREGGGGRRGPGGRADGSMGRDGDVDGGLFYLRPEGRGGYGLRPLFHGVAQSGQSRQCPPVLCRGRFSWCFPALARLARASVGAI